MTADKGATDPQPGICAAELFDFLVRAPRLLALAPHADDVALSIGGLLRLLEPGPRLTLATVFTRSIAAPGLPRDTRTAGHVSAVRAAEDAEYCRTIRAQRVTLDLDECGLRGYPRDAWIGHVDRTDSAVDEVRSRLGRVVEDANPSVILAPLGVGDHVDHILVREALSSLSLTSLILLYEDLPYAGELQLSRVKLPLPHADGLVPATIDISSVLALKLADLALYPSQLTARDFHAVETHAQHVAYRGGRAERLWMSSHDKRAFESHGLRESAWSGKSLRASEAFSTVPME